VRDPFCSHIAEILLIVENIFLKVNIAPKKQLFQLQAVFFVKNPQIFSGASKKQGTGDCFARFLISGKKGAVFQ
jgi:hypothetical protein